nr:MAG TPA: Prokaryotic membrane lipoprotein lipid attachment site [Caudoviricetes sp.]
MKKELIAVAMAMALTGCGGAAASNESTTSSTEATVESTTAAAAESVSTEDLVAKVQEILPDYMTPGTSVKSVEMKDKDLYISVDLSKYDGQFPLDSVAETSVSEITDPILSLDESYYNLWDTVTLDFGDQGHVTFDKSMIKDDGAGKYFSYEGNILQK